MFLKRWHLAAVAVVVLTVGCSAAAAPAPDAGPRWTDRDAIMAVQVKLLERVTYCESHQGGQCSRDPVLKALYGIHPLYRYGIARSHLRDGAWAAAYEPADQRWRVESAVGKPGEQISVTFYVYEKTGMVEGVAPTQ